jgi:hypothetical protein
MSKFAAIITTLLLLFDVSLNTEAATNSSQEKDNRVYVVSGNVYTRHGSDPAHKVNGSEAINSSTVISTGSNL